MLITSMLSAFFVGVYHWPHLFATNQERTFECAHSFALEKDDTGRGKQVTIKHRSGDLRLFGSIMTLLNLSGSQNWMEFERLSEKTKLLITQIIPEMNSYIYYS